MKRYNTTKRIFSILVTVLFVFSLFIITVSADVIWYTDEYILVGNENYTVNQTMNFSYREHTSVYLLLNHTYYNISSPDTVNITLDYLHENISNTTNEDLVLGFYMNISGSSGNVFINLSGFTDGYSYAIYRESGLYATVTANSTGDISFNNSDWSPADPLFRVFNNEDATWYSESFGGQVEVLASSYETSITLSGLTDTWNMTWDGNRDEATGAVQLVTYTNSSGIQYETMILNCVVNETTHIDNISIYHDQLELNGGATTIDANNITVWVSANGEAFFIPSCDIGYGNGIFGPLGGYIELNASSWTGGGSPWQYNSTNNIDIDENVTISVRLQLNISEGIDLGYYVNNSITGSPTPHIFAYNETTMWETQINFTSRAEVTETEEPTWYSESFGGSVTVTELGATWHSSSFGGSVTLAGYGNWSEYWVIGQTVVYDCTDPLDLKVNTDDINVTVANLTLTGANGWILADVNDDGVVNYLDIGGVCFWYPWDYGE